MEQIFDVLGTSEFFALYGYRESTLSFSLRPKGELEKIAPSASQPALDLLERLLAFNPGKRITVEDALEHPYVHAHHSPSNEVIAVPIPSHRFDFEQVRETSQLRKILYDEIMGGTA